MTPADLKTLFSFFTTDEERLDAVIDLGKDLKDTPQNQNCVTGCSARVDLDVYPQKDGTFQILVNSDSIIMRGFMVILKTFYAHPKNEEISDFLHTLRLDNILSTQRQNGLASIIQTIEKTSL